MTRVGESTYVHKQVTDGTGAHFWTIRIANPDTSDWLFALSISIVAGMEGK